MLVLVACLSSALSAAAYDFSAAYNGKTIYYNITSSTNKTVEVTLRGHYDEYFYYGDISIPSTVTYNSTTYTVTAIGDSAFFRIDGVNINSISSITLPSTVTTIGKSAFQNQVYCTFPTLPSNLKTIKEYAFQNTSLVSVTIPNSVTSIGEYAFHENRYLKSLTFGSGITELPSCVAKGCPKLDNVTIGSNVTNIGAWAFYQDSSLTQIVIPDKVTTIEIGAFEDCRQLWNVTLGSAVTEIDMLAFNHISYYYDEYDHTHYYGAVLKIVCKSATPPTLTTGAFDSEHYPIGQITVPSPSAKAAYQAADNWSRFTTWYTEQDYDFSVNGIYYLKTGSNTASVTYRDRESLTYSGDVFVPKTVTTNSVTYNVTGISYGAFGDIRPDNKSNSDGTPDLTANTGLYSVVIGNNVTTLGEHVFVYSPALHSVDFGPAVTSIGSGSFEQCTALKSVVSRATTPPTFQSGQYLRGFADYTGTLYVPSSAVNTYKAATYWKNFATIRALPTLDEALNVPGGNFTFTSTGTYPWKSMVYNGAFYAMSGNDGVHSSSSTLTATVTVPDGGVPVSFDFKAWGEGSNSIYDKCIFSVDGTQQFSYGASQNDWVTYTVDLSAGTHTLTWTYTKDSSVNPKGDYFAVRNVRLNIEPYAVYTSSNKTLTFYYDTHIQDHDGTLYLLNDADNNPEWYTDSTCRSVTKVVFDPSFAGARPTSTRLWFANMTNLTSITGLSYLNTEEVTNMQSIFWNCSKLTSIYLSNFNTAKVTNMYGMFYSCTGLTSLNLSRFNTAKVTNMNNMFRGSSNLTTIYAGSGWTTNAVTQSSEMFLSCDKLVGGQGTTYSSSHVDKAYAHIDGGTSNPGYLTEWKEAYACYTPSNTTLTFYYDGQRSSRTGTTYDLNTGVNDPVWYTDSTCRSVTKVVFNSSFANARPTSTRSWFAMMKNLTSITGLSYLNTSNVTTMYKMFDNCTGLTSLNLSNFNTAKVTNMYDMFWNCTGLTSLNVSSFNTSNVTTMSYMFGNCSSLTSLDLSGFNTSIVTNMGYMFRGCSGLTSLDLSSFNTARVTNTQNMFYGCSNLTTIYAGSGWTTNAVTTSGTMFLNCTKLVGGQGTTYTSSHVDKAYAHIDGGPSNPGYLSEWKETYACYTPSNTTLTFYYDGQRSSRTGTTYDLNTDNNHPGWYSDGTNVSVTKVVFDSSFGNARPTSTSLWFASMGRLTSITGLSYLNTENVTTMLSMFHSCSGLTSLDLSSFNTANVTTMGFMFYNCSALTTIYAGSGWTTDAVINSTSMFYNCTNLVGGKGTTYNVNYVGKAYAHIDGGPSNPGYLTDINASQTGDVNGDGSTTIADVTLLIDILLNNVNAPAEADVNGDGFVTIADVTALIDMLLGS